ncbi:MAG: DUF438 domain-containing protein [Lancefieldella sp.]
MQDMIDLDKSVYEICTKFPAIKDLMAENGFKEITEPGRLQTMGRFMTIPKGCAHKGVDLEELKDVFRAHGFVIKGDDVAADKSSVATVEAPVAPGRTPTTPDENPIATTPEERKALIAQYLERLNDGEDIESVREDFARNFRDVSGGEISTAEQELIAGGVPMEKVLRLCDVHASLFEGHVSCAHNTGAVEETPGHPVWTMRQENDRIMAFINDRVKPDVKRTRMLTEASSAAEREGIVAILKVDMEAFDEVFIHYKRKEELLFPHLERHDITGPSKVMWGKDDEVRNAVHGAEALLETAYGEYDSQLLAGVADYLDEAVESALSMVSKEENVLIPLSLEHLSATQWTQIASEENEFGHAFGVNPPAWHADPLELANDKLNEMEATASEKNAESSSDTRDSQDETIRLSTGEFTLAQLEAVFATIPLDITFVDANDKTRYFSHGDTRAFPRPKSCLGRDVYDCHPPKSQEAVRRILTEFKSGKRDVSEFWFKAMGKFLYVRYFAVRDEAGNYLGALETTQDIGPIKALEGENRRGSDA